MDITKAHMATWRDLDEYVINLESRDKFQNKKREERWNKIKAHDKVVNWINEMIIRSYSVKQWFYFGDNENPDEYTFTGKLVDHPQEEDPKILIRADLNSYERDKTLFHELAHLFCDNINPAKSGDEAEIITEWLGRKMRANPELLRHAIISFGLSPHVYDKASYEAFCVIEPKIYSVNPILEEHLKRSEVFMD